jgi:hypothetical protein
VPHHDHEPSEAEYAALDLEEKVAFLRGRLQFLRAAWRFVTGDPPNQLDPDWADVTRLKDIVARGGAELDLDAETKDRRDWVDQQRADQRAAATRRGHRRAMAIRLGGGLVLGAAAWAAEQVAKPIGDWLGGLLSRIGVFMK